MALDKQAGQSFLLDFCPVRASRQTSVNNQDEIGLFFHPNPVNRTATSFPDGLSKKCPFNTGVAASAELDRQAGDEPFSSGFSFFSQPAPDLIDRLAGQLFFAGQLIFYLG
jgi:hypothetical protein